MSRKFKKKRDVPDKNDEGENLDKERLNEFKIDEVEEHHTKDDCWLIIGPVGKKRVYDVTAFLDDHPGGPDLLLDLAGQDAQDEFEDIEHSEDARKMLKDLCIGVLLEDIDTSARQEAEKNRRILLLRHPETIQAYYERKMHFVWFLAALSVVGLSIWILRQQQQRSS